MSIGEEDLKGNELTREANRVLKESRFINFIGNVEGRHVFNGTADVIVTDGFTGNVALKVSEAVADAMAAMIRQEMSRTVFSRLGALGSWQALARFEKRIDYGEYGGGSAPRSQCSGDYLPRAKFAEGDQERDPGCA